MSEEYNYPTAEELEELINKFVSDNNLDAWWIDGDEGYLAFGINCKLEDEKS
jgi:hypothetical protein